MSENTLPASPVETPTPAAPAVAVAQEELSFEDRASIFDAASDFASGEGNAKPPVATVDPGVATPVAPVSPPAADVPPPPAAPAPPAPPAPVSPAATPAPTPSPAPPATPPAATPAPTATPAPQGDAFDAMKFVDDVVKDSIHTKKYTDDGVEVDGSVVLERYSQVTGPMKDMIVEVVKRMEARSNERRAALQPMIEQAQTMTAQAHVQAESAMIAEVTKSVPDAATLMADERILKFVDANPQYASLISTDVKRAGDLAFVLNRAREACGIAAPSVDAAPAKPASIPRSVQAASSSLRGGGAAASTDAPLDADSIFDAAAREAEKRMHR